MSCRTPGRAAWPSAAGPGPVLAVRGAGDGAGAARAVPGSRGRPGAAPGPAAQPVASSAAMASPAMASPATAGPAGPRRAADRGNLTVAGCHTSIGQDGFRHLRAARGPLRWVITKLQIVTTKARNAGDVRQPRSIIFYAWALVAAQLALAAGVIAFVLVGGARQRAELEGLHARAQAAQLANLTMVTQFLGAQRAVRAY